MCSEYYLSEVGTQEMATCYLAIMAQSMLDSTTPPLHPSNQDTPLIRTLPRGYTCTASTLVYSVKQSEISQWIPQQEVCMGGSGCVNMLTTCTQSHAQCQSMLCIKNHNQSDYWQLLVHVGCYMHTCCMLNAITCMSHAFHHMHVITCRHNPFTCTSCDHPHGHTHSPPHASCTGIQPPPFW